MWRRLSTFRPWRWIRKQVNRLRQRFASRSRAETPEQIKPTICKRCGREIHDHDRQVCEHCGWHARLAARQRISLLVDPDSFVEIDRELESSDRLRLSSRDPYARTLRDARKSTGLREAVIGGEALLHGCPIVIVVFDFRFIGGSMGAAVGEKIARAFEHAVATQRPIVIITSTGGARIQEGMIALMQMAKTASAVRRLHEAQLPFISVLAHPTSGGVYASFANLADMILAEPDALIGFAGPRVVRALTHEPLPPGSHTAEFQFRNGMIDRIVDRRDLRDMLGRLLALCGQPAQLPRAGHVTRAALPRPRRPLLNVAWSRVTRTRRPDRPSAQRYIDLIFDGFIDLHGDRRTGDDPAIIGGAAWLGERRVMVIAQERSAHKSIDPGGFYKSQRLMKLAAKYGLPLVTFIDTIGANPRVDSEAGGVARAIATSLQLLAGLRVPTVSIVIGEGGSGGALALGLTDRVLMQSNAFYSVISPEGAASILLRDPRQARRIVAGLRLTAWDLKQLAIIDRVLAEPRDGAHRDAIAAAATIEHVLRGELDELSAMSIDELLDARYAKYRAIGNE